MEEDGYLFLRGFFKREDALAARKVVTDRLMANGILDPNHPAIDGIGRQSHGGQRPQRRRTDR